MGDEIVEHPLLHALASGLANPNTFGNLEIKTVGMAGLNVMHPDGAMAEIETLHEAHNAVDDALVRAEIGAERLAVSDLCGTKIGA